LWVQGEGVSGVKEAVRTAVRFPLQLALHIQTEDGIVEAVTRNVSSNGLLFVTPNLPQIGSQIEFAMDMPSKLMGTSQDVMIHCIGRIVRHQHAEGESMAAAVIDEYFLKAK
jgi:hypothetical protein